MAKASTSKKKVGSVRSLVLKINTDEDYRAKFLNHPVEELAKYGISVAGTSAREVRAAARDLQQKLPDIAKIPTGAANALQGRPQSPGDREIMAL